MDALGAHMDALGDLTASSTHRKGLCLLLQTHGWLRFPDGSYVCPYHTA